MCCVFVSGRMFYQYYHHLNTMFLGPWNSAAEMQYSTLWHQNA